MHDLTVRRLGRLDYLPTWEAMRELTSNRGPDTGDEIWFLEHPPVFTFGRAGKREHLIDPGDIPVVRTDRGGQVTYHGPGQLVVYVLLDLRRRGIGIRRLVETLEQSVIDLLETEGVRADRERGAPGVYVGGRKVAALGLRVQRGCSYHGLAVNVDMDLEPYTRINPCGYPGLEVTQLADLGLTRGITDVSEHLLASLLPNLSASRPLSRVS